MPSVTFVSRRESGFRQFPPASAQLAIVIPFYGELPVWVRQADGRGWHFPMSSRRTGETIVEVARRELWDSTRMVTAKLDLLGAIRQDIPKQSTAYVYMCDVRHLGWTADLPEGVLEAGVFVKTPKPLASEWTELILEAAQRARRTGLR